MRETSGPMGSQGGGFTSSWPPVCKWLLIANIVVFLLQIFIRPNGVPFIEMWLGLGTDLVLSGQVWRLVTMAFCHDPFSLFHILFNMLFLVWFGFTLERMYGSREFFAFYMTSALIASFAYIAVELVTGERHGAIGASGAIMGVLMLYAMHYPRQKIYVFMIVPVEIRWIVLLYVAFDLHPVLLQLAGQPSSTGVAHAAHLGGLAFGFLYSRFRWTLTDFYSFGGRIRIAQGGKPSPAVAKRPKAKKSRRPKGPKPKFTVVRSDALEMKVDELLQKISDEGTESLTEEERKFLERASEQYRTRDKGK